MDSFGLLGDCCRAVLYAVARPQAFLLSQTLEVVNTNIMHSFVETVLTLAQQLPTLRSVEVPIAHVHV